MEDFVSKMTTSDNKKLISKDKVINLIKAGAFDRVEGKPREQILKEYITTISDTKQRLTLQNFMMLMKKNLVPDSLTEEKKCYNFTKYIRKMRRSGYYEIDEISKDYLLERFPADKIEKVSDKNGEFEAIKESWWDYIYNRFMDNVRAWIRQDHDHLLHELNDTLLAEELDKYGRGNILDWELQSLNFFYSGHPLDGVDIPLKSLAMKISKKVKLLDTL